MSQNDLRSLLHDLFNALAIAQGMTEAVKESLEGTLELSDEVRIHKVTKSLASLEKADKIATEIRKIIREKYDQA